MKKTPFIVLVAVLSSLVTAFVFKYFDGPQQVIVQEKSPAKYTNFKAPSDIESRIVYSSAPTDFSESAKTATPSVVHISAKKAKGNTFEDLWGRSPVEASSGSGVIISSEGYVVTNNHVIEDGNRFEVTLNDRRSFDAELLGVDPSTDLALLKLNTNEKFAYVNFADSDSSNVGEWVLAVGNPFNLNSTVTAGIISAKARNINILDGDYSIESFIQTDAAVNPGNSGGALVNTRGELIGINTAIITRSGRYEGYSFAVPSNLVQKVVLDLKEYGVVQRGFLGVLITDVTKEIAEKDDLPNLDGVYISRVNNGSAADEAGLLEGDIITHINGIKVNSTPELQEQVARFRPGNELDVVFLRRGVTKYSKVTLKNKSNTTALINKRDVKLFDQLGAELRDLKPSEVSKIDTDGVMVVSITRGGKIFHTNMEPGFVITKINDKKVKSLEELLNEIEKKQDTVMLEGVYEDYPGEYYYEFDLD
ncbi:MAG: trypsin-like peptidase domain-containing protein [Bacteroidota bacterium]